MDEKGKQCSTQMQGRAFKMKITPALKSYIGILRPENKIFVKHSMTSVKISCDIHVYAEGYAVV
jgi:hypothetical protein